MAKQNRKRQLPPPASADAPGVLYVVAVPIGNLADLSPRAQETLASVTLIASETLSATRRLLSALNIACPRLVSYREENGSQVERQIIEALQSGQSVALVSEAGTPAVSDPGWQLVQACRSAELPVRAVAGPSALAAALSVAGVDTRICRFLSFPPHQRKARREFLQAHLAYQEACILFESPHRIAETAEDLLEILGPDQQVVVTRELTKLYEETRSLSLADLRADFLQQEPRGEYVLVVPARLAPDLEQENSAELQRKVEFLMRAGLSHREVVEFLTRIESYPRNQVYNLATACKASE